jgi:hypothetical protein
MTPPISMMSRRHRGDLRRAPVRAGGLAGWDNGEALDFKIGSKSRQSA